MDYRTFIGAAFAIPRVAATLLAVLGILALFLAALGIYGVMSQHVGQRTYELGVRLALGARPTDVLRLILTQGLQFDRRWIVGGSGWRYRRRWIISGLLIGVGGTDAVTWLAVPLGLLTFDDAGVLVASATGGKD